ncbi:NAD(P)/FAD-dependent oxidoreductase [Arthrobacter sunyaminii]|uniref:NAD(P)/FAD-dependent oxidoreductase n=1 Tax=Arthrobacter sunyaminii TaxID=2816859 RepID=A0A975S8B0_9MICC|nr:NAD(P)/FAD-dependent oxidoreductase [Arthrobacter sunyaminii]MBO0906906.1 NAD(P)/FAD-dependent oxidoreductase [Arthrobacter sunyaminii]QWQ37661.1 NAD(P)/FAD-dependent oxidoreductase [Arthrobacter sunyaminii]
MDTAVDRNAESGGRFDVVVIGGAAAGLSGALALALARRSVLVVDAGEPRNAPAAHIHNYLGREGAAPADLYSAGRDEVRSYGGTVRTGRITSVTRGADGGFLAQLADGERVHARRVLAASGVADILPDLPGIEERWGTAVLHCPYCHGWEVRDKAIGILATDIAAAMHQALLWRQWSADVVLFLHTAGTPDAAQAEQLAARGIRTVTGEVTAVEGAAGAGIRLAAGELVNRDALVVFSRLQARAGYLAELGIVPANQYMGEVVFGTAVPVDFTGATPVPGVYAAGNLAAPSAQVMAAAAAGLMAGAAINGDLAAEETALAVEAARARPGSAA